jgi:6-pyruvoyltetrahydropterin/6-carboxytetrahydropterin synthase
MRITKEFSFDSAHKLDWHSGKCKNLHGHTYKLMVTVEGELNDNGIVVDFDDIKKAVKSEVLGKLDHAFLNDIISNPTVENIVIWIWDKLKPRLPSLLELKLHETPTSSATYCGE